MCASRSSTYRDFWRHEPKIVEQEHCMRRKKARYHTASRAATYDTEYDRSFPSFEGGSIFNFAFRILYTKEQSVLIAILLHQEEATHHLHSFQRPIQSQVRVQATDQPLPPFRVFRHNPSTNDVDRQIRLGVQALVIHNQHHHHNQDHQPWTANLMPSNDRRPS